MPYITQWVIDNRIIKTRIKQNLSPETKEEQDNLINQLLNSAEKQATHIILDCRELHFPTFRTWRWLQNPHLGWVVLYGISSPVSKFAIHMAFQLFRVRFQFADDDETALTFLQEVDITLPKAQAV